MRAGEGKAGDKGEAEEGRVRSRSSRRSVVQLAAMVGINTRDCSTGRTGIAGLAGEG